MTFGQPPEHSPNLFHVGGSWGDAIDWLSPEIFCEGRIKMFQTEIPVVGWKSQKPRVGDFLQGKFENSVAMFYFSEVTSHRDPPDMFFGKVIAIKQTLRK